MTYPTCMARTPALSVPATGRIRQLPLPPTAAHSPFGEQVRHALDTVRDDLARWGAGLAGALRSTGGELRVHERRWAEQVLCLGVTSLAAVTPADRRPSRAPHLRLVSA